MPQQQPQVAPAIRQPQVPASSEIVTLDDAMLIQVVGGNGPGTGWSSLVAGGPGTGW